MLKKCGQVLILALIFGFCFSGKALADNGVGTSINFTHGDIDNYSLSFSASAMNPINFVYVSFYTDTPDIYHLQYSTDNGNTWQSWRADNTNDLFTDTNFNSEDYTTITATQTDTYYLIASYIYPNLNLDSTIKPDKFRIKIKGRGGQDFNLRQTMVSFLNHSFNLEGVISTGSGIAGQTINCGSIPLLSGTCQLAVTLIIPDISKITADQASVQDAIQSKFPFAYIAGLKRFDIFDYEDVSTQSGDLPIIDIYVNQFIASGAGHIGIFANTPPIHFNPTIPEVARPIFNLVRGWSTIFFWAVYIGFLINMVMRFFSKGGSDK